MPRRTNAVFTTMQINSDALVVIQEQQTIVYLEPSFSKISSNNLTHQGQPDYSSVVTSNDSCSVVRCTTGMLAAEPA